MKSLLQHIEMCPAYALFTLASSVRVKSDSDSDDRRHDADTYFRIIDRLREVKPELALSGDFIVGFPGETDLDFMDTLKLIDRVGYASAYISNITTSRHTG